MQIVACDDLKLADGTSDDVDDEQGDDDGGGDDESRENGREEDDDDDDDIVFVSLVSLFIQWKGKVKVET